MAVEWPDEGPRPWRAVSRAVCDAADASPDPRLLRDASMVVLATREEVEGACLASGVNGCWFADPNDADGAGVIYLGPPGDGGQVSDATLRHELGHLARWRWMRDADDAHEDAAWWARFDTTETR